jgi:hypothetical protein
MILLHACDCIFTAKPPRRSSGIDRLHSAFESLLFILRRCSSAFTSNLKFANPPDIPKLAAAIDYQADR